MPPSKSKPLSNHPGLPDENPFSSSKPAPKRKVPAHIVRSGNAGNAAIKSAAPPAPLLPSGEPAPAPPPPLFPPGYKTPLSLLTERCQKNGWERPTINPTSLRGGLWTASVTLRRKNLKTGVMDVVHMRPPPSPSNIAVERHSAMEAKHWAAVYALYRFSNNLRLNLQLPPQTRDYWAALESEKARSTPNKQWLWSITPFETAAAAPPPPPPPANLPLPSHLTGASSSSTSTPFSSHPSSRSTTPTSVVNGSSGPSLSAQQEKYWLEAPEVKMPAALRDLVEETIRSMLPSSSNLPSSHLTPSHDEAPLSPLALHLLDRFTSTGFRKGHVLSALSSVLSRPSAESLHPNILSNQIEQHLHIHVPESDLPASFAKSKPPDASARIATNQGSEELGISWKIDKVVKDTGFTEEVVRGLWNRLGQEEGAVVALVGRRVVDALGVEVGGLGEESWLDWWDGGRDSEERELLHERREDEVLGLEGMLGERLSRTDYGLEIALDSVSSKGKGRARPQQPQSVDQITLRVIFHPSSAYPSASSPTSIPHLPTFYVYSPTLPPYIRVHLTTLLYRQFLNEPYWLDLVQGGLGGVLGELVSHLDGIWADAVEHPPESRDVMRALLGSEGIPRMSAPAIDVHQGNGGTKRGNGARNPIRRQVATREAHDALRRHWDANFAKAGYQKMLEIRARLPAWSMKDQIVDLIRENRVVIVSGETGSGKTTQVPSFVLDDAIQRGEGASINIIVTQPRRVSAIGVATRVGAERLEDINDPNSRFLVGYGIRGERKASRDCRVLFCTTGVVLARLSRGGDKDLEGVSHIFIDEVHERSVDSDFLLLELRDILKRNLKLKVILMSATINQAQFSNYYGGAPCIEIPGFTHPVQDHWLEDTLPHLSNYQPGSKPSKKATQSQLDRMRQSFIERGVTNERTLMALESLTRSERIDYNLVGAVARYCLERSKGTEGGVLVFMPGVFEIKQAVEAIRSACPASEKIEVFPLHANLSSQEQTAVFRPVKPGFRKVVVATNVAETSITIDGIVYVIDCGRVKENTFDPETGIVKLVETWTSKAASKQRRGRAGRTRPGECFKLFTHYTEESAMDPFPTPEIVRIPLEMLCLQIKAMREDEDVKVFLGKALDPPDVRAVESSLETLRLLGAIEVTGGSAARLTPLGQHLSMIPLDLRLGKMLVLAAVFRCLDPILTVVALLSSKPFFLSPMEKREEATKARSMFYSSRSDLLSDVKAFDACVAARNQSNADQRLFAEDNFISLSTFRDVVNLRGEYLTALSDVGFVPFRASASSPMLNENASNENLLKAIIFAGTGRLVKVKLPPTVYEKGISGTIERDRLSKEVKYFEKDGRVFLHPGSLLFTENRFATPFMTFFNKHVTTKPFLRDATEVPLYGVLLFGQKVNIDLQRGLTVGGDGWIRMRAWPRIGVLVNSLRQLFDADLEANLEEPGFHKSSSAVVQAMLALLERDGGLY